SGSVMADLQAGLATLGPKWGPCQLGYIDQGQARDPLARLSAAALSIVDEAVSGSRPAVPESEVARGENAAAQFLIRWRGEADPRAVVAVDTYWISAAEHGLNASTFTARIDGGRLRRGNVVGGRDAVGAVARRSPGARAADARRRGRVG